MHARTVIEKPDERALGYAEAASGADEDSLSPLLTRNRARVLANERADRITDAARIVPITSGYRQAEQVASQHRLRHSSEPLVAVMGVQFVKHGAGDVRSEPPADELSVEPVALLGSGGHHPCRQSSCS